MRRRIENHKLPAQIEWCARPLCRVGGAQAVDALLVPKQRARDRERSIIGLSAQGQSAARPQSED